MSNRHRRANHRPTRASVGAGLLPVAIAVLVVLLSSLVFWRLSASPTTAATGAVAFGGGTPSLNKGPSTYSKPPAWCGNAGLPACPTPDPGWIPLAGNSPTAAASAISQSGIFAGINAAHQGKTLDLPVAVFPLDTATGSDYYDDEHWVVSVRNAAGVEVGIYDFVFDSVHLRMRFASYAVLSPTDARYGHVYPTFTASSAIADLSSGRGLAPQAGTQPQLVFFQLPDSWQGPLATHHWVAGGQSPIDPLWRMVGSDGKEYFIGVDHNVYNRSQLPLS